MFELGLRLAFDNPTIIIKDKITTYSFDTGPIKHLNYRSDLRIQNTIEFMDELTLLIKATAAEAAADSEYSPFLKTFARRPKSISQYEGTALDFALGRIDRLSSDMSEFVSSLSYLLPPSREARIVSDVSYPDKISENRLFYNKDPEKTFKSSHNRFLKGKLELLEKQLFQNNNSSE